MKKDYASSIISELLDKEQEKAKSLISMCEHKLQSTKAVIEQASHTILVSTQIADSIERDIQEVKSKYNSLENVAVSHDLKFKKM